MVLSATSVQVVVVGVVAHEKQFDIFSFDRTALK